MPEQKALPRRPNALSRSESVKGASAAALGIAYTTGAIAACGFGFGLLVGGVLGVAGLLEFFSAFRSLWKARELESLGLELRHAQRNQHYDVSVRINPEGSLRVTGLVAVLEAWASVIVDGSDITDSERVFTLTESLFDSSKRLGHGEELERSASIQLPPTLSVPFPQEKSPSINSTLTIIVEVEGSKFLEHKEKVQLDLPRTFQVTLSQM